MEIGPLAALFLVEMNRVFLESAEAPAGDAPERETVRRYFNGMDFDLLPEDLRDEILCRLPLRSVLLFRRVCKGWLSLAASPLFLKLFERHNNLLKKDYPVGIITQGNLTNTEEWFVVCSGLAKSRCFRYSFEFLPPNYTTIAFSGCCHDLMLCCSQDWLDKDYFIMNCVTRKWAPLPPVLRECHSVLTGLVCDPTSVGEAKRGGKLRFRAVRFPVPGPSETELNVEIFSSDDGRWNEYVMRCGTRGKIDSCQAAVACNGSLYWNFPIGGKILALDPFNPTKKGLVVIESPPESFHVNRREERLGVHGGKLRVCHTKHSGDGVYPPPGRLKIWELEEEEEGEGGGRWRSVKVASLVGFVAEGLKRVHPRASGCIHKYWTPLALHPLDEDVVYFGCTSQHLIISCNLKTRRLKYVCDYDFRERFRDRGVVFPIVMLWSPTPVPEMPAL